MERRSLLGIDIGFDKTGWVQAEMLGQGLYKPTRCGFIKTVPPTGKTAIRVADKDVDRCQQLCRALQAVYSPLGMRALTVTLQGIVVEVPSGGSLSGRSARCMGMATGVIAAMIEQWGLPARYVTPQAVKKAMMGRNKASKAEIMAAVCSKWPYFDWPTVKDKFEHIADAMAALEAVKDGLMYRTLCR